MIGLRNKLIGSFVLLFFLSFGQKENNNYSIDFHLGTSKPLTALTDSFFTNYVGLFHADLGVRYMFKPSYGVKLDLGFDHFKNDEYRIYNYSKPFSSNYARLSIQGVVNIGHLLHFPDFTKHFGLIAKGGFGYALSFGDSSLTNSNRRVNDNMFHLIYGLSPQIKLNDRIALQLDLTLISNIGQTYNFDFKDQMNDAYGMITNITLGAAYYIGKHKTHYDWQFISKEVIKPDTVKPILKDSTIIVNLDQDKDLIVDSIDICPEVPGLAEFDGCPQPEISYDCNINDFPVFAFKGARYEVSKIYQNSLDSIAKCLIENKNRKIIIYGYADIYGDSIYTMELSQNRAEAIKKELVLRGVNPERIFALGQNKQKAKLNEKVAAEIKHNRLAIIEGISNNNDDIKVLATNEFLHGLFFTVQIGSYKTPIKNNKFNKLGKVLVSKSPEGFTRYSINIYGNYEDAYQKWKELRNYGFAQDAFVAAYFLGEKITIKEAQQLLLDRGSDIIQKEN